MTHAEYRAAPGVSNTMLGHLARSPMHLQQYLASPPESTPELRVGAIFHAALLEPETAWKNVAICPEGLDGRTKEGKQWKQENAGKECISHADAEAINEMIAAVEKVPNMIDALSTGLREHSLFADFGSVTRKGRLDLITRGASIVDFKTTRDASRNAFARSIADLGYARQAAYYLDLVKENGMSNTEFVFVAVEKEPPYAVGVYVLDQDSIGWGRKQYVELLQRYIECRDKNEWPGYSPEPQMISLPQWATRIAA